MPVSAIMNGATKICETVGSETAGRKQYSFLGHAVGLGCLCAVLGMGRNRLQKAAAGMVDSRFACNVRLQRSCPMSRSVDSFLLHLHGTVAEVLPTGLLVSIQMLRCFHRYLIRCGFVAR